ncbi:MAG: sigma-E processing peptidase SpoIIGA [Bacillota bacterium]|nr:sigma-E processing peptidase SpoIIGA [Bacillota bacterium]
MTYTVYLDEVLAGNLVMNFAILWVTARFSRCPAPLWRLAAAAALGALYVMAIFLCPVPLAAGLPAKLALSVVMLLVAFGFPPWRTLGGILVLFYLCSFGLGGLVFGLSFLLGGGPWDPSQLFAMPQHFFWPAVAVSLLIAWGVGQAGRTFLRRRQLKGLFHLPVTITLYGRRLRLEALLDTGNQLADPLSHAPVIVVEYEAVRKLLPEAVQRLLSRADGRDPDYAAILESLRDTRWATRFRLIPFSSLGRAHGLLLGFRPDEVEVVFGRERLKIRDVIVAIYQRRLSPEAGYRALLNPRLLETGAGIPFQLAPN